jgi:hypothetical protein
MRAHHLRHLISLLGSAAWKNAQLFFFQLNNAVPWFRRRIVLVLRAELEIKARRSIVAVFDTAVEMISRFVPTLTSKRFRASAKVSKLSLFPSASSMPQISSCTTTALAFALYAERTDLS